MTSLSSKQLATEPRIVALLRLASEAGQRLLYERTAAAGYGALRPAHFRLLRFPGVDGVRPIELADRLGVSKQAINPLINDLERWGYVERRRDASDRRGRTLHLTERGTALMTTIQALHATIEDEWEERLGSRRFATLRTALSELASEEPPGTSKARLRIE